MNIENLTPATWKQLVHGRIKRYALITLTNECLANKRTNMMPVRDRLEISPYIVELYLNYNVFCLDPEQACLA